MFYWIVTFFVLSLLAGAIGFGGLATGFAWSGLAVLVLLVLLLVGGFLMQLADELQNGR